MADSISKLLERLAAEPRRSFGPERFGAVSEERFAMPPMPGSQAILPARLTMDAEPGAAWASQRGLYGGGFDPNDVFTSSVENRLRAGPVMGSMDVDPQYQAPIVGLEAHRARQQLDDLLAQTESLPTPAPAPSTVPGPAPIPPRRPRPRPRSFRTERD